MELPDKLLGSLIGVAGFDKSLFTAVHQSGEQITSVRINPKKIFSRLSRDKYSIFNSQQEKIPWTTHGYYLPERPSFTLDPLFHAGAYYVQEASSMFLEQVLKQTLDLSAPLKLLDLCAAPGGKSTLIQSLLSEQSLLVCNEVIKSRVTILAENITKWGAANVIVTNNDARDFQRLENYFDAIIVDAPCSGSGLFRKDANAIAEWSEQNVELCSQRQQRILADIVPALNEGGVLIYSTCSYSMQEDEEIGDWLVNKFGLESIPLRTKAEWNIIETESKQAGAKGYRFYPDKLRGEGFFIAAFKKKIIQEHNSKRIDHGKKVKQLPEKEIGNSRSFLFQSAELFFFKQNDELLAMPSGLEQDLAMIQSNLYIKKAGVTLGTVIRGELIPGHELALYYLLDPGVKKVEVDLETALQYLRKSDIDLQATERGWVLITHLHLPLGWVKILPNRVNNYYPAAWRILNK